jgi:hypothetical protein
MLKHNLLQLGLQQLLSRSVIDFTRTFRQACEQIHVDTWVPILDAQLGFKNRLGNKHKLNNKQKGIEQQGCCLLIIKYKGYIWSPSGPKLKQNMI